MRQCTFCVCDKAPPYEDTVKVAPPARSWPSPSPRSSLSSSGARSFPRSRRCREPFWRWRYGANTAREARPRLKRQTPVHQQRQAPHTDADWAGRAGPGWQAGLREHGPERGLGGGAGLRGAGDRRGAQAGGPRAERCRRGTSRV